MLSHHHSHIVKPDKHNQKKILLAALITASYVFVEVIGRLWVNSIALVADGEHMMTDALALGMAWWGFYLSQKPVTERMSFGFQRFQILTEFVNGFTLLLIVNTHGGHYCRWSLSPHEKIRAYLIGRCASRIRN